MEERVRPLPPAVAGSGTVIKNSNRMGYIDLHNHILPGLDDGSPGPDEAVALARAMVAAGFTHVVATPHCAAGEPPAALIRARLAELQQLLRAGQIPLQLLPGAEHVLDPLLPRRLQEQTILTLNGSRFLLVEPPFAQPLPPYLAEMLFTLRLQGYYPVLAHPERAAAFQSDPGRLYRLVRGGALTQLTLGSITGLIGPAAARAAALFLSAGLGHFLATDAHGPGRLRGLERSLAMVDRLCAPGSAREMLADRPAAVLRDCLPVLPPPRDPDRPKSKRSRFHQWFFSRRNLREKGRN